ncbi:hypothetical protein SCHPADRAFT_908899 [Schizopora paradoxa]|uniref:Uncharacterized protein n=1 Tax=Schizopora paradoxa TaxID=27342 RepID=A0A0H2R8B5_9AGAM|nr:hypothetical protein SCHPADRAFT_908899 [Schizopora paradoxa]
MKNLQDLALEFTNTFVDPDLTVFNPFEIPQVRRLSITTTVHFVPDDLSPALRRAIFSSLFFPGVIDLIVKLKASDCGECEDYFDDKYDRDFFFNKEINRIFRHIDQFPLVESFCLDIFAPYSCYEDSIAHLEAYIPLNMLPSLKRIVMKGNRGFDIKEPEHPDEIFYQEEAAVAPRISGDAFPLLDSVTLDLRIYCAAACWIQEYLRRARDRRSWNSSFKLIIGRKNSMGILEGSYLGEKALEWCSDLLNKYKDGGEYEDFND